MFTHAIPPMGKRPMLPEKIIIIAPSLTQLWVKMTFPKDPPEQVQLGEKTHFAVSHRLPLLPARVLDGKTGG